MKFAFAFALAFAAGVIAPGAAASDTLTDSLRKELLNKAEQTCQIATLIDLIKSEQASAGTQIPPEFQDQQQFPLKAYRQLLQNDPATQKIDRGIEEGCRCVMEPFRAAFAKARTFDDISAFHKRVQAQSRSPDAADAKRIEACWAGARQRNK